MNFIINCPNCNEIIIIDKLNCGIFRHGNFIKNNKPINPHTSEKDCKRFIRKELVYGCGMPFKISLIDDKYIVEKCNFI